MIKPLTLIALFLLSFSALSETLRVATFNAEFLNKKKVHVKYGESFKFNDWSDSIRQDKFEQATKAVASFLDSLDSDILVLTEISNDLSEVQYLVSQMSSGAEFPYIAKAKSTDSSTGQSVAILSKYQIDDSFTKPRIAGREHYYTELDDPNSESDTGISKGLKTLISTPAGEFHIFGLHLKSERGGHESDAQRVAQASIVRRHLIPLLNDNKMVVVAGDLNDHRGEPTLTRLRGLDDIWPDLIQTGHKNFFKNDTLDERWTHEFEGSRHQIDHVLLSRPVINKFGKSKVSSEVLAPSDPFVSDHRAFVVTIKY